MSQKCANLYLLFELLEKKEATTLLKNKPPLEEMIEKLANTQRALKACGMTIEKLPGAPGKREMLRATKII
jgi:hypothetical protein